MRKLLVMFISFLTTVNIIQTVFAADVTMNGNTQVNGTVTATAFSGDGSGLTGITSTSLSNNSVTVNQLAVDSVATDKLQNDSVTPAKIAF